MRFPWRSSKRRIRHKPLVHAPFEGREALVHSLDEHLRTVREGATHYVGLAGPAGSGKSALLREFRLGSCQSAHVFVLRVNVNDCVLETECAAQLFDAVRGQSDAVLKRLYDDSKRLRKSLAVDWEEAEFRNFLTSAEWAQIQESSSAALPQQGADALTRLLSLVRSHPWGVGAAVMLDCLTGKKVQAGSAQEGLAWWTELLQRLRTLGVVPGAAFVIVVDQLPTDVAVDQGTRRPWTDFWRTVVSSLDAAQVPSLVIWAGESASLQPIQDALTDRASLALYHLDPFTSEELTHCLERLQHALPRGNRQSWVQCVSEAGNGGWQPGALLLATTCAAVATTPPEPTSPALADLVQATPAELVVQLMEASCRRLTVDESLQRQLVEVCAFLPPGKAWEVEEILPLCQLDALGIDAITGRTALEALLGQMVRHGLLTYDPYAVMYTSGNSVVQHALQAWLYPDEATRREVGWWRHVLRVTLAYVQRGERSLLAEWGALLSDTTDAEAIQRFASYLLPAFRHVLRMLTKAERLEVAAALEAWRFPLAVDLLQCFLADEEGQVRSRAVQSLVQLHGLETFPVLVEALRDANSDVRWIAARALSDIEGAATVDALIPLLTDEDKEVGRIAAEGLGQHGDRRAVPHLIAAMRDSYPLLRESAALALGHLADKRALPALRELLEDTSQQVRRRAEEVLARLSEAS